LPFDAPGITVTPLYSENFRVIVPAKHPWARRRTIRPDELAAQNLLLLNVGHCFRDQVLDACHEFTRPPAQGKEGNSLETIRNMVTSGMGFSVLPATALTPKYAMPQVRAIDFADRRRRAGSFWRAATRFRAARRWPRSPPRSRSSRSRSSLPCLAGAVRIRGLRRGMKRRSAVLADSREAHRSRADNHHGESK
jgi:DNA-binding transcriptional LysR family regulator